MIPLEQLPNELDREAFTCDAVVEAPAGSRVKVYYDPVSHRFRIGKFLPLGLAFPFDFAFVPSTLGGDGDPLDLLILPEATLPVGCIVEVRILGVLEVEQQKANKKAKRNDRIIARLQESRLFSQVDHIDQLGRTFVDEVTTFFQTYKNLRGQAYRLLSVGGPERSVELIDEGIEKFLAQDG